MLNVFITVDVEVWLERMWDLESRNYEDAFARYIYGRTARGDFGLPLQLEILGRQGLKAVFMCEPLFAAEFGLDPLQRIVDMIRTAGQEIQLHIHPEWARRRQGEQLLPQEDIPAQGHAHLCSYSDSAQKTLVARGLEYLRACGVQDVRAFRAGSFMANASTLTALESCGIPFDTSYNACQRCDGVFPARIDHAHPTRIGGMIEFPVAVFEEWPGFPKHVQVGANSFGEIAGLLTKAWRAGWDSFVIVLHGSELLNRANTRADGVVVRRFEKLCEFLAGNRDKFQTLGFADLNPEDVAVPASSPPPLRGNPMQTAWRYAVQAGRRVVYD